MKIFKQKEDIVIRSMLFSDIEDIMQALEKQGWQTDPHKFHHYLELQETNKRIIFIACKHDRVLGYVTLDLNPSYGPWKDKDIPMITDLNVFQIYQKMGVGSLLMDAIESYVFKAYDIVTLGVGLHHGYGQAQRLYIKRGYLPDGSGVWYHDEIAKPYETVQNDDDLNLYLYKKKEDFK
ncbi:MAG: GNAT family N-acetyltransferase [Bacillota bacterium]|nr:MAG: GNAT family N-acetyltransferase [Bacillota bacterium]